VLAVLEPGSLFAALSALYPVEVNCVATAAKKTLKEKFYEELKEFAAISLYLWLIFALFLMYKSMILAEEHMTFASKGFAVINALALGKVVLIARALHLGETLDDAPLIYPTLLKSALFSIVLAIFKVLEAAAVGWYRKESFAQSIVEIGGGTWRGILTLTVLLFVLLIPFFGFEELQRVLGPGKLSRLFFRSRFLAGQAEGLSR